MAGWVMPLIQAVLGGAASGAAGSAVGGLFGGGGGGGQEYGYDVYEPEAYGGSQTGIEGGWGYINELLNSLRSGKQPAWMGLADTMRTGEKQSLADSYYGTAGRPGSLRNDVQGLGAMSGVGPKALMTKGQQGAADYMSATSKIDQYIDSLKYNSWQNMAMNVPNMAASMPRSKDYSIINYSGGVGTNQQNPMMGNLAAGVGNAVGSGVNDWISGWGKGGISSQYGTNVGSQSGYLNYGNSGGSYPTVYNTYQPSSVNNLPGRAV